MWRHSTFDAATLVVGALIATIYTNAAIGLLVLALLPGLVACVMWWKNRAGLRALNDFLAEKARTGFAAIENQQTGA